jgi:hypothetical protein
MNNELKIYNRRETIENPEAVAFALGHLLGDGGMRSTENRLTIEQKFEEYTLWKQRKCIEYGLANEVKVTPITRKLRDINTGQVKQTTSFKFQTKSLFKDWHCFYVIKSETDPTFNPSQGPRRRKCVPDQIKHWFTHPLALSVFYMDDGTVTDNQPYFATGEFSLKEVHLLQDCFKDNFGLNTSIRRSNGNPVGFLVARRDCQTFLDLVSPYVQEVPCMRYKLNITSPDPARKVRIYKPRND